MSTPAVGIEHTLGLIADVQKVAIIAIDGAADPVSLIGQIIPILALLGKTVMDASQMKPELGDVDPSERTQLLEASWQCIMAIAAEALGKFAPHSVAAMAQALLKVSQKAEA